MSEDADKNPDKRYWASIAGGVFYIIMALCAATLVAVELASLPQALILALAGIALFGTIASSLQQALHSSQYSEAAIITFLVTASDLTLWSVGSACCGNYSRRINVIYYP